ncbi:hypothetical protein RHMOL_Rhmol02G0222300 [Rhododendron molle]|uniref:Uncharacterized protein n=1 Tax=Rhododendron molle TaxID=49168 RepID=A0ACC0PSI4_RHOML|nr:hypothetical protein RHMOL_Rhmol02G0222300 [Rhododendron molle]
MAEQNEIDRAKKHYKKKKEKREEAFHQFELLLGNLRMQYEVGGFNPRLIQPKIFTNGYELGPSIS